MRYPFLILLPLAANISAGCGAEEAPLQRTQQRSIPAYPTESLIAMGFPKEADLAILLDILSLPVRASRLAKFS